MAFVCKTYFKQHVSSSHILRLKYLPEKMSQKYHFYTKRNIVKINLSNIQNQSKTNLTNKTNQLTEAQHLQTENIKMKKASTNLSKQLNNTDVNMLTSICPTCDLHFMNPVYTHHVKMKHNYKCNICNKMFVNIKSMQDHRDRVHLDVNTDRTNNVLTFPTNKFKIIENGSSHLKVPQIQCNNINVDECNQMNGQFFPVSRIGMKNIEADQLNIAQTCSNNNLNDEPSQYIEVHKLQTNIEINKNTTSQLNKAQKIKIITQRTTQKECPICNFPFTSRKERISHLNKIHNLCIKNVEKLNAENVCMQMPVNKLNIKTDLTSQTHKIKINSDIPNHLKESQKFGNPNNFVENSQIIEKRFLPLKIIGMQNIGDSQLNKVQTQSNNSHTDELRQCIDVHMPQSDKLQNRMEDTQNINDQLKYSNDIHHIQNDPILKNQNSYIVLPVNQLDHLNFINTTNLEKDITNTKYIIPFSRLKDLKMNSTGITNCTLSTNVSDKPNLKLIGRPIINRNLKVNSNKCVKCHKYFVNKTISPMQAMHKKSNNKIMCSNCKPQYGNYDKLEANIALEENVIDKSGDMQIDEHVKLKYFETIQPVISQTICTEMDGVLPIVPNDEQMLNNNVLEHSQVNEHHNYQLQDKVANTCNAKKPVNKYQCLICSICGCQFKTLQKFKQHIKVEHKNKCVACNKKFIRKITLIKHRQEMHSNMPGQLDDTPKFQLNYFKKDDLTIQTTIKKFKCFDCEKQFIYPNTLVKHIQFKHIRHNNNPCKEKHVVTSNELDDMSKFQPGHVKMEESTNNADIDLINCIGIKDILPTVPNEIQNHLLHSYQTQEKVDSSCIENSQVIKRAKFVCHFCYRQFSSSKAFQQHSRIDRKFKCFDCGHEFICPNTFIQHIHIKHVQHNNNSCKEEEYVATSNQLDNMSKFQTGHVKMEESAIEAMDLINCIETKDLLPITQNDTQLYIIEKLEPAEILNHQLDSYEPQDMVASSSDDKEPVDEYGQYLCNICDNHFTLYNDYKMHVKQNCVYCEEIFICNTLLEKHIQVMHDQQNKIVSTEMPNVHFAKPSVPSIDLSPNMKTEPKIRRSIRTLHTLNVNNNIPAWFEKLRKKLLIDNRFVCEFCDNNFKNIYSLGYHLVQVHNYKCKLCKKSFVCDEDNKRHMHTKHKQYINKQNRMMPNNRVPCKECNTTFNTEEMYQLHIKYAHKLRPEKYSCSFCAAVLTNNEEFITHMKSHNTNDKPFIFHSPNMMSHSSNRNNYNLAMFGV